MFDLLKIMLYVLVSLLSIALSGLTVIGIMFVFSIIHYYRGRR